MEFISNFESDTEDFELFIRKLKISILYNVRWISGTTSFAFADLEPGESINMLRNSPPLRNYKV